METLALPGMPIKVGKFTRSHGSGIYRDYREMTTPEDDARAFTVHGLGIGESKMVVETKTNVPFIFLTFPIPRRITNVDGKLVKTFFRRPRVAA
jgi:hypothetical protein